MSQSSIIAFFLMAGFIIYITAKGELLSYSAIIFSNQQNNVLNAMPSGSTQQMQAGIQQAQVAAATSIFGYDFLK